MRRIRPCLAVKFCAAAVMLQATLSAATAKDVPPSPSGNDFKAVVEKSMGNSAGDFGTPGNVEQVPFPETKTTYAMRYTRGLVRLFVSGASIVDALDALKSERGVTCSEGTDFKDVPDSGKTGLILGAMSYTCSKADERDYVGFIKLIDDRSGASHLYMVLGINVPASSGKAVVDRMYEQFKMEYGRK